MAATVPYQTFHDEEEDIGVNEDDISHSGSEDGERIAATETHNAAQPGTSHAVPPPRDLHRRVQDYMEDDRWPKKIGVLHLVHGILLTILGIVQIVVLPLVFSLEASPIHLNKQNCYGVGLWTGILMGLSGTLALRASIFHSTRAMYSFVLLVLLEIATMSCFLLMIVVGYSSKWTTPDAYHDSGALFGVHIGISAMVSLAYIMVLHAFTQYYEDVLCGQLQLCRKMVHCCLPCWCPRVVQQEELLSEDTADRPPTERPPSLPV